MAFKSHPKGRQRPKFSRWRKHLKRIGIVAAFVLLIGGIALTIFIKPLYDEAQELDLTELGKQEVASVIYDRQGVEMGRIYVQNRLPVKLDEVPKHVVLALVAVEDSRFYDHKGVDVIGIFRAMLLNLKAFELTQGASTITQQLARQPEIFDLKDMSLGRKITEAFLARRIERHFSKEEILELYLNGIFFGHHFYGINAAAQGYFGKHVSELTIEEGATLCGLIKTPNNISPLRYPDRAKKERNYVLDRMRTENFLTDEDCERLKKMPVVTNPLSSISRSSHIYDLIRRQVLEKVGEERARTGGFRIFTTVDRALQHQAERSLLQRLKEVEVSEAFTSWSAQLEEQGRAPHQTYDEYLQLRQAARDRDEVPPTPEYLQGSMLAVDNHDGGIAALVGGRSFVHSQYNRARQARRPAGSAFMPFVYALAFQNGMYPGSLFADRLMDNIRVQVGDVGGVLGEWAQETEDPQWLGDITARKALSLSKVAATVRVGLQTIRRIAEENEVMEREEISPAEYEDEMDLVDDSAVGIEEEVPLSDQIFEEEAIEPGDAIAGMIELEIPAELDPEEEEEQERLIQPFLDFARRAGVVSPMRNYNSSFIGSSEITLEELCMAYTMFPRGGTRPEELYVIKEIQTDVGTPIYISTADRKRPVDVMDPIAAYQTHSILEDVLKSGTASRAHDLGLQPIPSIAGKTGTAYDSTDLWFVGYSSEITCGVWAGFDLPKEIYPGAFSNELVLPIWVDIMNATTRSFLPREIEPPNDTRSVEICTVSGQVATDACYEEVPSESGGSPVYVRCTMTEHLRPDHHISGHCRIHSPESEIAALRGQTEDMFLEEGEGGYRMGTGTPISLRAPVVVNIDPYNSVQATVKPFIPRTEEETTEEGEEEPTIKKAEVISETRILNEEALMQIEVPEPIELDD